jgi:hypothetical protein
MYPLFKFIHIVAAIIWIGGTTTLIVLNARLSRSENRSAIQILVPQLAFYGQAVIGPAAGITFLAGIATAIFMGVRFSALWITWGFGGIIISMVISAFFVRRITENMGRMAAIPVTGSAELGMLQRRLATLNLINLLVLLSVVAAMVFKPV